MITALERMRAEVERPVSIGTPGTLFRFADDLPSYSRASLIAAMRKAGAEDAAGDAPSEVYSNALMDAIDRAEAPFQKIWEASEREAAAYFAEKRTRSALREAAETWLLNEEAAQVRAFQEAAE